MPALLTRMPTGPSCCSAVETRRSTSAEMETSAWMANSFAAEGANGLRDGFGGFGLLVVVDGDVGAGFGESEGDGFAEAAACAGNQSDASGECVHRE